MSKQLEKNQILKACISALATGLIVMSGLTAYFLLLNNELQVSNLEIKKQMDATKQMIQETENSLNYVQSTIEKINTENSKQIVTIRKHTGLETELDIVNGKIQQKINWKRIENKINNKKENDLVNNFEMKINLLTQKANQLNYNLDQKNKLVSNLPLILPVNGWISSRFGERMSPFTGHVGNHKGIDIAAPVDSAIVAPADGVVVTSGKWGSYGKFLEIDHGNKMTTRYAHNGKIYVVSGQRVKRGQLISRVGLTGRTQGAHLHYEVLVSGEQIDPVQFIFDPDNKDVSAKDLISKANIVDYHEELPLGGDEDKALMSTQVEKINVPDENLREQSEEVTIYNAWKNETTTNKNLTASSTELLKAPLLRDSSQQEKENTNSSVLSMTASSYIWGFCLLITSIFIFIFLMGHKNSEKNDKQMVTNSLTEKKSLFKNKIFRLSSFMR